MNNKSIEMISNPSERWNELQNIFIDQVLGGLMVLIFFSLPFGLSRSFTSGWQPLYTLQIIMTVIFVCFYPFRKKASFFVKSIFAIIFFGILGIGALPTFGLAGGSGIILLVFTNFLVAVIFSPRTTGIIATGSLAIVAIIGAGIITGNIRPHIDANDYIVQISSWVTIGVGTATILLIMFRSMSILQKSTYDLLQEIHKQKKQIVYLANHDQLTGLPLMRLARDRLEIASSHAIRYNKKVAVLFIDLDGFKKINDTYGHESGDYVLQQTAQRIRQAIRAEDTIARISGDEFLAILGDVTEPQAVANIAKKIILTLSQPILQGDKSMSVGASIGISLFPDDASDLDTSKRLADDAMYRVKKTGKNNFTFINSVKNQVVASAE